MLLKENNPWLGLESYSVNDSERFYGRNEDIDVVSNTIYDNFITTIYGISGAGKTSLINAGITPALKQNGYLPVRIRLKHKSEHSYCTQIIDAICAAVESIGGEVEYEGTIGLEEIQENEKLWFFLHTRNFWTSDNFPIKPVLFIDQFEEIFTQNSDTSAIADFFDSISSIQHDTPPPITKMMLEEEDRNYFDLNINRSRMVFIIREDFLARLEDYSYGIASLRRNRIGIKRMNGYQAMDVILKPYPGIITSEGAIRILSKVSGKEVNTSKRSLEQLSIDTSILSLFCSELYERAVDSHSDMISEAIIEESGNDIISQFYAKSMALVTPALSEYLETHLLTTSGFRNSMAYEDIRLSTVSKEDVIKGLYLLSEKRILRIEDVDGVVRVEFTHDVLCKVAKKHRDSVKEESARKRTLVKTIIRTIEQVAIAGIAVLLLLMNNRYTHLVDSCFSPDWLLAGGLFATLFFDRKSSRDNLVNFGLSALLSLLLINIPVCWIHCNWISPYRYIIFAVSILLSGWTFLGNKGQSKTPMYMLMAVDVLLMILCRRTIFLATLVVLPVLATIPLKYSEDRNVRIICLIAAGLYFSLGLIGQEEVLFIPGIYALLGLFVKHKENSSTFKESFSRVLKFETWKKEKSWIITFIIIAVLGIIKNSVRFYESQADTFIIYDTPLLAFLIYSLLSKLQGLLLKNCDTETSYQHNRYIFRNGLIISGIALCIVLCQYVTYGFFYMLGIWITIAGLFIWKKRKSIISPDILKIVFVPLATILISTCLIPLLMIGYDISSNVKYAKVISKNMNEDSFIMIRDNKGNYGVRDIYNIIVPVKFSEISVNVEAYGIKRMQFKRNDNYELQEGYDNQWNRHSLHIYSHNLGNRRFPNIIFTMKDSEGKTVQWFCNEHLADHNICSATILESAKTEVTSGFDFNEALAIRLLKELNSYGGDASLVAQEFILKLFDSRSSVNIEINTFETLKEAYRQVVEKRSFYGWNEALDLSHKILSYVDDDVFTKYFIDTLCTSLQANNSDQYDKWYYNNRMAGYLIYANRYAEAEMFAHKAIQADPALTYAYKNMIVAQVLQNKFDEAYELLDLYGKGMHYMGAISSLKTSFNRLEMEIIHNKTEETSPALRFDNLFNGVYNELLSLKECNVKVDTSNASYKDFEAYVKSKCIMEYDSAEDMGGFYLCRKYEEYYGPLDEWYALGRYPQYRLAYQFYMKDNKVISPAFDTYAEGIDEDIMLLIDKNDKKRKYVDMTGGIPEVIPGEFDHAWRFSEGKAAVVIDGRLGFIDSKGKYVIDSLFNYRNDPRFAVDQYNRQDCQLYEYTFHGGLSQMMGDNGKFGLIDTKGNWVVHPAYDLIYYIDQLKLWLLKVQSSDAVLFGAADLRGEIMIPVENDSFILILEDGQKLENSGRGYFGKSGEFLEVKNNPHVHSGKSHIMTEGYCIQYDISDNYWTVTSHEDNSAYYYDSHIDSTW